MSYISLSQDGYSLAELTQQQQVDATMAAYRTAKKEIDDLLKATYANLSGVEPANYWAEMVKYDRYTKLSNEITKVYTNTAKEAKSFTEMGLSDAMAENYNRQLYLTGWLGNVSAIPINPYLLKYTTTGTIDYWNKISSAAKKKMANIATYTPQAGTLTQLFTKNATQELDRILQSLQNGLITGKSYRKQASAMKEIIGKYIKKTDTATGSMANALRIARTEGQRVLNAAALQSGLEAQSQGLDIEKIWISSLDSRTRSDHGGLDGQTKPLDDNFSYGNAYGQTPGQMGSAAQNINCRCKMSTIVDGETPEVRRATNPVTGVKEIISWQDYSSWSNDL